MKGKHERSWELDFNWDHPPFHIVLVEPKIPPNTGNIARLCAATGSHLHLVEPLGFEITDKAVKRAGLDYWESVQLTIHPSFEAMMETLQAERFFMFSTAGKQSVYQTTFRPGDVLIFGSETKGLSDVVLSQYADHVVGIPIRTEHVRSLNLSSAVTLVTYEALRQNQLD